MGSVQATPAPSGACEEESAACDEHPLTSAAQAAVVNPGSHERVTCGEDSRP
jgi:hypothetical protein